MSYDHIYILINLGVIPAWLLLILLPRSGLTARVVHSGLYPVVYGTLYAGFLINGIFFGANVEGTGMSSLAGVMNLFDSPNGTLTGWSHYLVFDLFVGAWMGRDAMRLSINHLLIVPCLIFTLMFGPIGLLLYLLIRKFVAKADMSLA